MPSRQDQLLSYQFMVQRVVAALVLRETDPARSPFRRAAGVAVASLLLAGIALGGVALYEAAAGGDAGRYRDTSAVIVERETGARYVYRDGRLHPVLNYASALLIVGSVRTRTVLVARRSIEDVPRGTPLGIAGAPDSLPPADRLSTGPWTICSDPGATGSPPNPRSILLVGTEPAGGRPLGEDGVLVRHPDGDLYLFWRDRRHLVRDSGLVLPALAWTGYRPVTVAPALLNAVPAGDDLAPMPLPDAGQPSRLPGVPVGEVFVVTTQGGGRQYAVARVGGLVDITELQADLLLTAGRQAMPTPLAQGRYAALPKAPDAVPAGQGALPGRTPRLVDPTGRAVCGRVADGAEAPQVRLADPEPMAGTGVANRLTDAIGVPNRTVGGAVLADRVVVPPGGGAVVEATPAPGATGGTVCVVTDTGRRYAVSGRGVLGMLGYARVRPVRLPSSVVALLPAGRALDEAEARSPVSG